MEPLHHGRSVYDTEFVHNRIGLVQRRAIWAYLEALLRNPGMHVLELNTGDATDAVHLARQGHRVIATDQSPELIRRARERVRQYGLEDRILLELLPKAGLHGQVWPMLFDLVLSDMGGLNQYDEDDLVAVIHAVAERIRPGGRFVAVIQPDRCIRETLHHLLRFQWREAFQRGQQRAELAGLSGTGVVRWNHAPATVERLTAPWFRTVNIRPVGLFVPPTHLVHRYGHRPRALDRLSRLDELVAGWRWTARYADHYLIDLERRR
ncbi:MAG: class I SAM-dependent methyltransferase [Flavobacteriales bacterium]|nr:class I SAM-dependent methyltransferase [Flavobacteriales bacterium]